MDSTRYIAELRPEFRLIVDEVPPLGTKLWMVTRHGAGFAGAYHPEYGVIAWCPLPKLTPEQKRRLRGMKDADIDPTIHPRELWKKREEISGTCVGYER